MPVKRWHAERALLPEGMAGDVAIEADGERFTDVTPGAGPGPGAVGLPGLVLPGLANAHSHAFHRALRGRTQDLGTFWSWREAMYALASSLRPDTYRDLARATFGEMALAGITAVGEFHYLHHDPAGRPYDDPNAMGRALAEAAAEAGVRITLIDACYLRGGFDEPLGDVQRRFSDGTAEAWAERASALPENPGLRRAAAIHSVRAVDQESIEVVRDWAAGRDAPLHVHVSEQQAENEACLGATGMTPAALLRRRGVWGPRTTAVHATHVTDDDVSVLGSSGTTVCVCPTTERDLADGIGPASALGNAGSPLCVGTDGHSMVDMFEEARAVELDQRLATGSRGHHRPEDLLRAATAGGMASLGWDAGAIEPGKLADLVAVDLGSPRLAGATDEDLVSHVVFAATASDVTHVVASGELIVEDRRHLGIESVPRALDGAIRAVREGPG